MALTIAPFIAIILILFGGFYVNESTIPDVLRWSEWSVWCGTGVLCWQLRRASHGSWECQQDVAIAPPLRTASTSREHMHCDTAECSSSGSGTPPYCKHP